MPKKSGRFRLCVVYRWFNAVTVRDSYPIPCMYDSYIQYSEYINFRRKARIFSTLNANSRYLKVEKDKQDVNKTAFVAQKWWYKYTRMAFGLDNTPATFQRAMNKKLTIIN